MPVLSYWVTVLITAFVVVTCVVLHYEGLRLMSDRLPIARRSHRRRIVFLILCLLVLHVVEVWIFGVAYYLLERWGGYGVLTGLDTSTIFDTVYFSATVYTTLGFGDIVPSGPIRFLTGTEALAGLTLITWSASFTFVEMLRTWKENHG